MTSSPNERFAGDIFPETQRSEPRQAAIDYMETVAFPRVQARFEQEERASFGELNSERSQRKICYNHDWLVNQGHEHAAEIIGDAALPTANCGVLLMLSAEHPDLEPMFGPEFIRFNGRGDAGADFTYPPDLAAHTRPAFLSYVGKCRTERRDYDVLVSAILLSSRHHRGDRALIRTNGAPDSVGWPPAFELYARTFPNPEISWLDNWP